MPHTDYVTDAAASFPVDYSPFLRVPANRDASTKGRFNVEERGVGGGEGDRQLRHPAMVYIRLDSSRVQIVASPFLLRPTSFLSLSFPLSLPLFPSLSPSLCFSLSLSLSRLFVSPDR